jgi:DNA-directed RNA polymerase specialized sigma24 family protein
MIHQMSDTNEMDLVREFARHNSESAFTELVRRRLNLVYSVARRRTGNDGDAQAVAQAVFIILARKARVRRISAGICNERATPPAVKRTSQVVKVIS